MNYQNYSREELLTELTDLQRRYEELLNSHDSNRKEHRLIEEELNLTNQKLHAAKQRTEQSEERFRLMIKNSNDSYVLINEKGEQIYISDAAIRDTGYSVEELKGPIQNVIFPEDLEIVLMAWNELLNSKTGIVKVQYRHKHKFKPYVWYEAVGQNFLDHPAIQAVVVNVRDITDIKKSESDLIEAKEKAEESNRLKTAFLQNLSHEIRTPLNAIMGFSELLVKNHGNLEKLKRFSEIIHQRGNDLLEIINDILDIAKIESGQETLTMESCPLNKLFEDLAFFYSIYQQKTEKQHISLHLVRPPSNQDPVLLTDLGKLKQIMMNLITNALKFTDHGSISIGYKLKNNKITFFVEDTGIGIPKEKYDFIFERFSRIPQPTVGNIGGTGLGLSIVKGLVELLGGEIKVVSMPGKGSHFSFSILYQEPVNCGIKQDQEIVHPGYIFSGETILIAEDDIYNAQYLKEILSDIGLNLLQTDQGKHAVQICTTQKIDMVLMDIQLPDISGYDAIVQIKKINPLMKIIAQTAFAAPDERMKAMNAGCCDYVSKPTKQHELQVLLKKHLQSDI